MKRLMMCAATLAALTILMPAVSTAQHLNQVGIYTDPAGDPATANFAATPNVPFDVYLVLIRPTNFTYNGLADNVVPVTNVLGFETKVIWPSALGSTFSVLAETLPGPAIDAAAEPDEYAVGFVSAVPVTGEAVVLATWTLLVTDTNPYPIYLSNIRFDSIDGEMAFIDADDPNTTDWQDGNLAPMWGSTGGTANPVFSINDTAAVSTVAETWGGVKSLFR